MAIRFARPCLFRWGFGTKAVVMVAGVEVNALALANAEEPQPMEASLPRSHHPGRIANHSIVVVLIPSVQEERAAVFHCPRIFSTGIYEVLQMLTIK